jgi:DNA transposition AAA+ family ATPase
LEIELARKLMRSPRPIFVDQANYLQERSLGTLCFLWEKRHIPIVLVGTKTLFDNFYQSKLTEDVRGQLTSRIALHYLLPELTKVETEAILRHALGEEVTDEMVEQIHQVTGGNFRSVDMIIPRILEIEQRNRQKLADGTVKMNEIIKVAAARLMV